MTSRLTFTHTGKYTRWDGNKEPYDIYDLCEKLAIYENIDEQGCRGCVKEDLVNYRPCSNCVRNFPNDYYSPRFEVTVAPDVHTESEDTFAICDNLYDDYYEDIDGEIPTFTNEQDAENYLAEMQK